MKVQYRQAMNKGTHFIGFLTGTEDQILIKAQKARVIPYGVLVRVSLSQMEGLK